MDRRIIDTNASRRKYQNPSLKISGAHDALRVILSIHLPLDRTADGLAACPIMSSRSICLYRRGVGVDIHVVSDGKQCLDAQQAVTVPACASRPRFQSEAEPMSANAAQ